MADSGRKAIIFSQWVGPLETLAQALREFNPLLYHGKVAHRDREPILDLFKRDPRRHILLMSYGTGSVGLNLQFTNYVFLFDRWWNPAVEDQAINRAHRLGQKEPVFITRFVTPNTIEGRIAEVLEKKRELFNELIGQNGPPPSLGLSEEDMFGLFDIRAAAAGGVTAKELHVALSAADAGQRAGAGTIRSRGRAEAVARQRNHGHRSAGHVKKLDAVAVLLARYDVVLDHRAYIAGAQCLLRQIDGENHVLVHLEVHSVTPDTS